MNIGVSFLSNHKQSNLLARDGFKALLIKITNAGLQLTLQILFARLLGAAEFGTYMFALAWVNILLILGKLGLDMTSLRFVSSYQATEDWPLLNGFIVSASRLTLLSSLVVVSLFIISTFIWSGYLSESQHMTLLVAMALIPLLSLIQVKGAILRGLGSIVRSLLPFSIIRHLLLIFFIGIGYLIGLSFTAVNAQLLTIVSGALSLLILIKWLNYEKANVATSNAISTKPSYDLRIWLITSIPLVFVAGFQVIIGQADIIIVNMVKGPEQGGVYAAMSQLSLLMIMGQVSINSVAAPIIAKLYSVDDMKGLQRVLKMTARLIFSVTLVAGIVLVLFGEMIIGFYGSEFLSGYTFLLIFVAGQVVSSMAGSVSYLMAMTNHQNLLLWCTGISALINLLLNLTFVPLYGALAAACITAATLAGLNISLAYLAHRKIGVRSTVFYL